MDRSQLIDLVACARVAADECQRLITAQAEKVRLLHAAGDRNAETEALLDQLESEFDRHLAEMERLLDELDKIENSASPGH